MISTWERKQEGWSVHQRGKICALLHAKIAKNLYIIIILNIYITLTTPPNPFSHLNCELDADVHFHALEWSTADGFVPNSSLLADSFVAFHFHWHAIVDCCFRSLVCLDKCGNWGRRCCIPATVRCKHDEKRAYSARSWNQPYPTAPDK